MSVRNSVAIAFAFLLCCAGCQRTAGKPLTTTMRPAPPRPSPLPAKDATIGQTPIITTTGSPRPWQNRHAEFRQVDVDEQHIACPPKIVRANVAFRITNRGTAAHALTLDSTHAHVEVPALPPGETLILQITLRDLRYTWTCREPGHPERTSFTTYVPNLTR